MSNTKFTSKRKAGIGKDRKHIGRFSGIWNGMGKVLKVGGGIHQCTFYYFASQFTHRLYT